MAVELKNEEYRELVETSVKYEILCAAYRTTENWEFKQIFKTVTGESSLDEIKERRIEFEKKMRDEKKGDK